MFGAGMCGMRLGKHRKKWESADKPGSVEDNHSSGMYVTVHLKQPTRKQCGPHFTAPLLTVGRLPPYLVLLRVGFAVPSRVTTDAVRSYRTLSPLPATLACDLGGLLSVALSVGSRLPGVTWHSAQWSPDFPPLASCEVCSDCLADSRRAWCRAPPQQASTSLNWQKNRHRTQ